MVTIHPTAVVEKNVQLGPDVVIGPYCVIGKGASLGAGTILDARVVIIGDVTIGRENRLYPNCVIGCCPQVLGMDQNSKMGSIVIGDHNAIRENVTIHPSRHEGHVTRVGSDNLLMVGIAPGARLHRRGQDCPEQLRSDRRPRQDRDGCAGSAAWRLRTSSSRSAGGRTSRAWRA